MVIALDALSLLAFAMLAFRWMVVMPSHADARGGWLLAAALCASLLTDLASGIIHWGADTWGSEQWPIIGKTLIGPFREHHVDPKAICRHDLLETNGANALVLLPVIGFAGWLAGHSHLAATFTSMLLGVSSLLAVATNQIHKWAHRDDAPAVIRLLQRTGIILGSAAHAEHHRAPFDRYYCITHGWLNPLLTRIRFFRAMEAVITRVTGAVPRREDLGNLAAVRAGRRIAVGPRAPRERHNLRPNAGSLSPLGTRGDPRA